MSPLLIIAVHFAMLSLVAVGGMSVIVPELHRLTVEVHRWFTAAQFKDLFVIAQAAPGPNVLLVALVGWQVAGLAGALVATVAMCGPACVLTYFFSRAWDRFRGAPWQRAVEAGLAPISVGLVLATGYLLMRTPDTGVMAYALAGATTALVLGTGWNPLWIFAVGAGLGLLGLV